MPADPIYPGVYISEIPGNSRFIPGVPASVTAFIGTATNGPADEPVGIRSFGEFELTFGGLSLTSTMSYAVRDFFLNGGKEAVIIRILPSCTSGKMAGIPAVSDYLGNAEEKTGMHALAKAEIFNLLCIPPAMRTADTDPQVYREALNICCTRRAMLILDSPFSWSLSNSSLNSIEDAMASYPNLNGTEGRNAALFFPRIIAVDPLMKNKPDVFPACGAIAGLIARTDEQRGIWKAPAGIEANIRGIEGLQLEMGDRENGSLNSAGINCLRTFPVYGPVIWGSRTLRGADKYSDEYKYIPVRRLALYIEESIARGIQWAVFEPNAEPLWATIRQSADSFLYNLFRSGAFAGTTAKQAYFVKCDQETTTQNDVINGRMNLHIGFAPLKPAEFVLIRICCRMSGTNP